MIERVRATAASSAALLVLLLALLQAQGNPPATPLTLIAREGRRAIPTTILNNQELIALDDVASLFQVAVREDTLAGGVTVTYRGRTIVISPDQPMASVDGRLVTLPTPLVRSGRRWLVPLEFLPRALSPIYDVRIELRRPSRLLLLGDVRVPRVSARIDAPGPPTRATIEIAPAAPVATAIEAGRVVMRIDADALDVGLPAAGAGLIEQFRLAEQPTSVAAVLSGRAGTPRVATSTADNVTRIALDVPAAAPIETAVPGSTPGAPTPPVSPKRREGGPASPKPPGDEAALAAPLPGTARRGLQTIVIDPGHGGDDVGARGAGGTAEKQITLDVARRARSMIEMRLGVRVILTRDDDRAVGLDERAAAANNTKADLFLSLHLNAALSPRAQGAEVYYLGLNREIEDARRSAEADAVALPVLGGANRTIEVIPWDLAQARHVEASATLATILEEELRKHVPMGSRPLRQAPVRVLSAADMPAALIEMAYLTNGTQEKAAHTEAYQTSVAEAIYATVVRFRSYGEGTLSQ
jgi:N-acetylmuramoyl-L-alanine amidase